MRYPIKSTGIFTQNFLPIANCVQLERMNREALVFWDYETLGQREQSGLKFGFVITKIESK